MALNKITVKPFNQSTAEIFGVKNGLPSNNILSAAFSGGKLFVGTDKGVAHFDGGRFVADKAHKAAVQAMFTDSEDRLWLCTGDTVSTADGKFSQSFSAPVVSVSQDHDGTVWLMTQTALYTLVDGSFINELPIDGCAENMAAFAHGEVYACASGTLQTAFGKRARWFSFNQQTSSIPDARVNCVAGDKFGMVWVGTENGIIVHDCHNTWLTAEQVTALTKNNVTKLLFGRNGKKYVGTDIGLYVYEGATRHFYGVYRWLPDKQVTALAESPDGSQIWVGTPCGISCIETKLTTLSEKAARYQEYSEKYNVRRGGFVTQRYLDDPTDISSGHVDVSDNDGLWTGCYLISQAYRYAVTKDEEALSLARRSMNAMLKLMSVTKIPGFTARAIRRPGEWGYGNGHPEWHKTTDEEGDVEWKGETSSDEMVGHFTAMSAYYDLCADDGEKKRVSAAICAIVNHILEHNYRLHDEDGKPTTWANWNPEDLNGSDRWYWEHGINSLEILSFLKTAYHMSGDEKYEREYRNLIENEHYALNAMQHKRYDYRVSHIDDNLGFLVSMPLLTYETDPELRNYYLMGMRHHWEYERAERCPMWNILYGAFTNECCDLDRAIQSLKELPAVLLQYHVENSCRKELVWNTEPGLEGETPQLLEPLPYDEKPLTKYDTNPYWADDFFPFARLAAGSLFLMPYWIGRYYGLIEE